MLPEQSDGYLLLSEFSIGRNKPVISRRYIKVGTKEENYKFYIIYILDIICMQYIDLSHAIYALKTFNEEYNYKFSLTDNHSISFK
jgi:hypothetical protein